MSCWSAANAERPARAAGLPGERHWRPVWRWCWWSVRALGRRGTIFRLRRLISGRTSPLTPRKIPLLMKMSKILPGPRRRNGSTSSRSAWTRSAGSQGSPSGTTRSPTTLSSRGKSTPSNPVIHPISRVRSCRSANWRSNIEAVLWMRSRKRCWGS